MKKISEHQSTMLIEGPNGPKDWTPVLRTLTKRGIHLIDGIFSLIVCLVLLILFLYIIGHLLMNPDLDLLIKVAGVFLVTIIMLQLQSMLYTRWRNLCNCSCVCGCHLPGCKQKKRCICTCKTLENSAHHYPR